MDTNTHFLTCIVDGGIAIVEMLFCTSLVALVGIGDQPTLSPRRLKILNTKRSLPICELTFPTAILRVLLNRKRLIVLLQDQIYIYDISNMQLLHTIETSPNPAAIAALSPNADFLAYPSLNPAEVVIFDTDKLVPVNLIPAHKSALAQLTFNSDGTLLATASDKGTIVRVFAIPSTAKLYQFRRGTYPTRITSLAFDHSSTLLACSGTSTVHLFKLKKFQAPQMLRRLPSAVQEMWEPQRDFAFVKVQDVVKVGFSRDSKRVFVVTGSGLFLQFVVNEEVGGACDLVQQYSLLDD